MDAQPHAQSVPGGRLGATARAAPSPLDAGPQMHGVARHLLGVALANPRLGGVDVPLVGSPPIASAHLLPEAEAERTLEAVRCRAWFGAGLPGKSAWASSCPKPPSVMPVPSAKGGCGERKPLATQEAPFDSTPYSSDACSIPTVVCQSPVVVVYTERALGRRQCGWCGPCPAGRPA